MKSISRKNRVRLCLERLEERAVPAHVYWHGTNSKNWNDQLNWKDVNGAALGRVPNQEDDVHIKGSNPAHHDDPYIRSITVDVKSITSEPAQPGETRAKIYLENTTGVEPILHLAGGVSNWAGDLLGWNSTQTDDARRGVVWVGGGVATTFNWDAGIIEVDTLRVAGAAAATPVFNFRRAADRMASCTLEVGGLSGSGYFGTVNVGTDHQDTALLGHVTIGTGRQIEGGVLGDHYDSKILVNIASTLNFNQTINLDSAGGFIDSDQFLDEGWELEIYGLMQVNGLDEFDNPLNIAVMTQIENAGTLKVHAGVDVSLGQNVPLEEGQTPFDRFNVRVYGLAEFYDGARIITPNGSFVQAGLTSAVRIVTGDVTLQGSYAAYNGILNIGSGNPVGSYSLFSVYGDMRLWEGPGGACSVRFRVKGNEENVCDRLFIHGTLSAGPDTHAPQGAQIDVQYTTQIGTLFVGYWDVIVTTQGIYGTGTGDPLNPQSLDGRTYTSSYSGIHPPSLGEVFRLNVPV